MVKANVDLSELLKPEEKKDMDSAFYEVLKHMTDEEKATLLTELSDNDLKLITRLEMLEIMRKQKHYGTLAKIFIKLRISKDRQSRAEILKAIKNAHPEGQQPMGLDKVRQLIG